MIMRGRSGAKHFLVAVAALALAGAACQPADDAARPAPGGEPPAAPPAATGPPRAASYLPELPGYRTDDAAETGEIRSSLDHGEVPYVEIRRRLILGEQGFAQGEVMVLTFEPGAGGPERFLAHWFGEAERVPVTIAGERMHRIPTQAHDALAWTGGDVVVVFSRGAEVDDAWLEELAAATVRGR